MIHGELWAPKISSSVPVVGEGINVSDGIRVGVFERDDVGVFAAVGVIVGVFVGTSVGNDVGADVGDDVGVLVGVLVGVAVGHVIVIVFSVDHVCVPQLAVYRPILNKNSPGPE